MSKFKVLIPDNSEKKEIEIEADKILRIPDRIILVNNGPNDAAPETIVASFPGNCSAYLIE